MTIVFKTKMGSGHLAVECALLKIIYYVLNGH